MRTKWWEPLLLVWILAILFCFCGWIVGASPLPRASAESYDVTIARRQAQATERLAAAVEDLARSAERCGR